MSRALRLSVLFPVLVAFSAPAFGEEPYRVIYPKDERPIVTALAQPARPDHSGTTREILEDIADAHRVSILIDEQAIANEGISLDDQVDLVAENADLNAVLDRLLEPHGLTYLADDGVLKITTERVAATKKLVRAYDVAGLLGEDASIAEVGQAVSQIAAATSADPSRESIPFGTVPQVVPFRNLLIVIGNRDDHERVRQALEIMSQIEEE